MTFSDKWLELEKTILGEVIQTQKDKYDTSLAQSQEWQSLHIVPGITEGDSPLMFYRERWPLLCPFHGMFPWLTWRFQGTFGHAPSSPFSKPCSVNPLLPKVSATYLQPTKPWIYEGTDPSKKSPTEFTDCWLSGLYFCLTTSRTIKEWKWKCVSSRTFPWWTACMHLLATLPQFLSPSCSSKHRCGWWVFQQVDGAVRRVCVVCIIDCTALSLDCTLWCTVSSVLSQCLL